MKALRFTSAVAIAVTLGCVSLAACASPPRERIVTQRVEVPIPVPCDAKVSPRPVYPTEQRPIPSDVFEQMQTALAELALREAREQELEAALSGCSGKP